MKTFKQIFEAKKTEVMIRGPEKAVMKIIKKFGGDVDDVTDKGHALVSISADKISALKSHMDGMGTKGFDLQISDGDGGFDDAMI